MISHTCIFNVYFIHLSTYLYYIFTYLVFPTPFPFTSEDPLLVGGVSASVLICPKLPLAEICNLLDISFGYQHQLLLLLRCFWGYHHSVWTKSPVSLSAAIFFYHPIWHPFGPATLKELQYLEDPSVGLSRSRSIIKTCVPEISQALMHHGGAKRRVPLHSILWSLRIKEGLVHLSDSFWPTELRNVEEAEKWGWTVSQVHTLSI